LASEAVKAVPVVSTAVRLLEGFDDIKSKILRAKLIKFLSEPGLIRSINAQKLREEILENDEDSLSIGDTLFLIIEKVTDLQKPLLGTTLNNPIEHVIITIHHTSPIGKQLLNAIASADWR
jgi:hypothetical protein